MVTQADSTLAAIKKLVRRLTASPSATQLSESDLEAAINTFYSQDFPYAIKTDQMRSVYTFFTEPYIDRYPLDIFYDQSVRGPIYVDGIQGNLYKDRQQFYNLWPRFPTKFQEGGTTLTGTITGIAQPTNPTQITSVNHNLTTGAVVTITGVGGMTQLNGNSYTITVIDANTFSLNGIDNTPYGGYTGGGTWTSTSQTFSFTIPGPFLSREVTIGGLDVNNAPISINDDGNGNLFYLSPNSRTYSPALNTNPAIPGMYNANVGSPGLNNPQTIGSVDYVGGTIDFTLPSGVSLGAGQLFTVRVAQYTTGRPYTLLFWNNEFTIRPVPKLIHKVEVETYLTPVQFLNTTDNPIVQQWWQYIGYGVAREILRQRQDLEGVANLEEGFLRQEALVLERQANEELFVPNYNLFNSTQLNWINGGFGQGGSFF